MVRQGTVTQFLRGTIGDQPVLLLNRSVRCPTIPPTGPSFPTTFALYLQGKTQILALAEVESVSGKQNPMLWVNAAPFCPYSAPYFQKQIRRSSLPNPADSEPSHSTPA